MEAGSSSSCGPSQDSSSASATAPSPSVSRMWSWMALVDGMLSLVVEPTAVHLRATQPARATARVNVEASPGLCYTGYQCSISQCIDWDPPVTDHKLLQMCNFCRLYIGSGSIYVYKSASRGVIGFCNRWCQYDYITPEKELLRAEAAAARMARRATAPVANGGGRMFFL